MKKTNLIQTRSLGPCYSPDGRLQGFVKQIEAKVEHPAYEGRLLVYLAPDARTEESY